MISHIGTGGSAGDGDRSAERNPELAPICFRRAITEIRTSAVEWRDCKGFRLALLPCKPFAGDQIQADIYNMKRFTCGKKISHLHVVVFGEACELVKLCAFFGIWIRGAGIGPDEPASIHGVQRKLIDVDPIGHQPAKNQKPYS